LKKESKKERQTDRQTDRTMTTTFIRQSAATRVLAFCLL